MKEILDFLSKLSDKDPLMVLLIIIVLFALALVLGGIVAYAAIRREQLRDNSTAKSEEEESKKDSAWIALANTLALQGARALDQGATLNELLKRQGASMDRTADSMQNQGVSLQSLSVDLNNLKNLNEGHRGRLADIATLELDNSKAISNFKTLLSDQETLMNDLRSQTNKDIEILKLEIDKKFLEIKEILDKLEIIITKSIKPLTQQTEGIEVIKGQLDTMATAVSLISDNMVLPKEEKPHAN